MGRWHDFRRLHGKLSDAGQLYRDIGHPQTVPNKMIPDPTIRLKTVMGIKTEFTVALTSIELV